VNSSTREPGPRPRLVRDSVAATVVTGDPMGGSPRDHNINIERTAGSLTHRTP
jgi:hypothetical protein